MSRFSLSVLLRFRPLFRSLVDSYFRDVILAESHAAIRFRVREKLVEFTLKPVIARVDPDERAFPHGRIVYEIPRQTQTETDSAIQSYHEQLLRLGAFHTVEFEMLFASAGKRLVLPLMSDGDGTRSHQYRRFERFEGGVPVELFLKDCGGGDGDIMKLHLSNYGATMQGRIRTMRDEVSDMDYAS